MTNAGNVGHFFISAIPGADLLQKFGHVPGTDCARCKPHVGVAMPVLILGAANFGSQER